MTAHTLEEETAPLPRAPQKKATYKGFGFAEVKPHNADGITRGLHDLIKRHRRYRANGLQPQDVYLITYIYEQGKDTSTVLALRPNDEILRGESPITSPRKPGWVDSLGTWYHLGPALLPTLPGNKTWIETIGPVVRGSMIEPIARDVFIAWLRPKRHTTATKMPHKRGADVRWRELAEYLYELASELSPPR